VYPCNLQFKAYKYEDRLLVNPGSATGAYGSLAAEANPSFVLMDIDGRLLLISLATSSRYFMSRGTDIRLPYTEFEWLNL